MGSGSTAILNAQFINHSKMSNIQDDLNRRIREDLDHVSRIRKFWSMNEDPGPGEHQLQGGYILRVIEWEKKNATTRTYSISTSSSPRDPITLSFDWLRFSENLSKRDEGEPMTKQSIHDSDLREKIRLKCRNDWNHDLDEDQISMCIIEMEEQRLSLFHDQIWPNHRKWKDKATGKWMSRITWDKAINGYRAIAHRSGRFAGVDATEFEVDENNNLIARVTVYALDAMGKPRPYVGEARFDEFVQLVDEYESDKKTGNKVPNNQWSESPRNQLAIAAERQALRKAFQELGSEPRVFICEPEPPLEQPSRAQAPEPPLEDSRGIPTSIPKNTSEPEQLAPDLAQKNKKVKGGDQLKYVGIPTDGFQPFKKYNGEERIIMVRAKGDAYYLALDSGFKVVINSEGYEEERTKRADETRGGFKWKKGETYFDGSTVEALANSKKDELELWLALDNGFKVLIDRWGKEIRKKERKKDANPEPINAEPVASAPEVAESVPSSTKQRIGKVPQQASEGSDDYNSEQGDIDPESVDTIEIMRKITAPLLRKWFKIVGKSMSPKDAYKEFTGVILSKGQAMTLDDYKVLYCCLEEAINDA